jgi:uncharacterized protein YukE
MQFEMPMATQAMNNKIAAADPDGECWTFIGAPLDQGVDRTVPDYDGKLELNLNPKSGAKRAEISDLKWGKITHDAARLDGLAAAIDNISSVIKKGKDQLAHEWKGKSFDAFRTAIEKVEKTLNDYSAAIKTTGQGVNDAISGIQVLYNRYRDSSQTILKFDGMQAPSEWWKMSEDSGEFLAEHCISSHGWSDCTYNNDEQQGIIKDKLVNNKLFNQLEKWDCTDNPGVTVSQYRDTVRWAEEERTAIRNKINEWYQATDGLKTRVSQAYDAMLDNMRIVADLKVFQSMQTPAAPAGTGDGSTGTGSTGDGSTGTGSTGTGSTGTGSTGTGSTGTGSSGIQQPPIDQPDTQPEPPGTGTGTGTDPQANESVTIEDGDRKITVDSPDGQGHVKVTVDDGTGKPKTYDLDFGTSPTGAQPGTDPVHTLPYPDGSGTGTPGQPEPGPGVPGQDPSAPIQAGPDGKCVISDPPLTITAERPAGTDDKVVVTIDDGSGKPTTYTLDYAAGGNGQPIAQPQPLRPGIPDGEARILPAVDQGVYESGPRPVPPPTPTEPVNVAGPIMGTDPAQGATVAQGSLQEGPATGFGGTSGGVEAMLGGTPEAGGYTGLSTPNASGEAGLASAVDSTSAHPTGPSGGMAGGMPMMGGMAAGGGGDDYDRAGSAAWRTTGDLFDADDDYEPARFGGVLEPDDPGARR